MNFAMSDQKPSVSVDSTVVATTEQISAHFTDSVVILGLRVGSYYSLDEVGAFVWNLVQEPHKVSDVRDAIFEEYEVELAQCERDLLALLEDLAAKELIDIESDPRG
jgi:hypothetical protein